MERTRPSVVWIHGWGQSPRVWDQSYRWLPDARHSLFTYADCDSVGQMRSRLHQTVSGLTGPVYVIGWSLGGMLALEMVLDSWESGLRTAPNPGDFHCRIERLVLVGATLRFVAEDRASGWPERVVRRMRSQLADKPRETLQKFAESMFSERERRNQEVVVAQMSAAGADTDFTPGGLDTGLAYLAKTDLTQRWQSFIRSRETGGEDKSGKARIAAPQMLWLHGEEDPICPAGALQAVPASMKVLFPGAGHAPFWTEPDRFAEQLRRIAHEHQ
ncbi:alpha/beta fold hydrolase [Paenibacillus oceani]|uniref:Alpha/beta fold hydrolase n=1 Tax=Paenibacillus oceani TaxID=2772510 RepID=A0A927CFW1_9BACL|nr:alpha/beta fold hydrolase [Paenibacillus oceani]MBD2865852.1 alpha/beta fold hydrolase [Paenibacillus oceani]